LLLAFGLASRLLAGQIYAAQAPPQVIVRPSGPIETVFRWQTDRCSADDIPDDGAHAFRDFNGTVHLIASHYINWAFTGKSLNQVRKDCQVIYQDRGSADPSAFDDAGWLESVYTLDGRTVYGLVSLDFHPQRHNLPCASQVPAESCWYSTITQATSTDGGFHFKSPQPGVARMVATSPYKFDPTHPGPAGVFVVSNTISYKGTYYAFISTSADRAQKGGDCLMRTENLAAANAWRAWDGTGFNVRFVDPYTTPVMTAALHVCEPVSAQLVQPVRSLLALEDGKGFIVTMQGGLNKPDGAHSKTILVSSSADLLHWSEPQIVEQYPDNPIPQCRTNKGPMFNYPAMLDPNSASRNFGTVGPSAYIYMTMDHGCGNMDRDLVRLPVTLERQGAPPEDLALYSKF
jgi:hypothetical protein